MLQALTFYASRDKLATVGPREPPRGAQPGRRPHRRRGRGGGPVPRGRQPLADLDVRARQPGLGRPRARSCSTSSSPSRSRRGSTSSSARRSPGWARRCSPSSARRRPGCPSWSPCASRTSRRPPTASRRPTRARRLQDAGADIVGINCLRGPEQTLPLIEEMRKAVTGFVACQPVGVPDAGRPARLHQPGLLSRSSWTRCSSRAARWRTGRGRPGTSASTTSARAAARWRSTSARWPARSASCRRRTGSGGRLLQAHVGVRVLRPHGDRGGTRELRSRRRDPRRSLPSPWENKTRVRPGRTSTIGQIVLLGRTDRRMHGAGPAPTGVLFSCGDTDAREAAIPHPWAVLTRKREYDAIVVGLGGIGSGAVYWLSRRLGGRVLGLEQFELGHHNGASQDHSRIIRLSYHRADYVRLARRAYETWTEVERESATTIVTRTGGLDVAPRDAAIPLDGLRRRDVGRGRSVRAARRAGDRSSLAAVAARRRASRPVPGRLRDRRSQPGQRRAPAPRSRARRDSPRALAGHEPPRPRRRDRGRHGRRHDVPDGDAGACGRCLDERPARALRAAPAAHDHPGAGHVLRGARSGRLRPGAVPDLDLDGRPVLLWLPGLRRGRAEGGPGCRRA